MVLSNIIGVDIKLSGWIKAYFGATEDLSQFKRRNIGRALEALELIASDDSRGYVFVWRIQLDRNLDRKIEKRMREYERNKCVAISKKIVDYDHDLAAFSWRRM